MKNYVELTFTYNGIVRKVKVHKVTAEYVQGENLHADASRQFATYSKSKMVNCDSAICYKAEDTLADCIKADEKLWETLPNVR